MYVYIYIYILIQLQLTIILVIMIIYIYIYIAHPHHNSARAPAKPLSRDGLAREMAAAGMAGLGNFASQDVDVCLRSLCSVWGRKCKSSQFFGTAFPQRVYEEYFYVCCKIRELWFCPV